MTDASLIGYIVAKGIPALLIFLGFIAFMEGKFFSMLGISSGTTGFGILLIVLGVGIYILEIFVMTEG